MSALIGPRVADRVNKPLTNAIVTAKGRNEDQSKNCTDYPTNEGIVGEKVPASQRTHVVAAVAWERFDHEPAGQGVQVERPEVGP